MFALNRGFVKESGNVPGKSSTTLDTLAKYSEVIDIPLDERD
jgi:hypothetical protein